MTSEDDGYATAGRILIRFLTTDGEWSEIYDGAHSHATLQMDGIIDITNDEAALLLRLVGSA